MEQLGIRPESMRSFIEAIGIEKVTNVLSKEERLKDMSKQEIISALSQEDMISALGGKESLLKLLFPGKNPEELQKLLAQSRRN
ncbi:MAG: hypothetical protein AAB354_17515 [candidate division KSB1 bacterium]